MVFFTRGRGVGELCPAHATPGAPTLQGSECVRVGELSGICEANGGILQVCERGLDVFIALFQELLGACKGAVGVSLKAFPVLGAYYFGKFAACGVAFTAWVTSGQSHEIGAYGGSWNRSPGAIIVDKWVCLKVEVT